MMLCFVSNLWHLSNPSSITADSGISFSLITNSEQSPKSTTFTSSSSSSCRPNKWSKTLIITKQKRSILWLKPSFRVTVSDQICENMQRVYKERITFALPFSFLLLPYLWRIVTSRPNSLRKDRAEGELA